jgi:hypothetical protein
MPESRQPTTNRPRKAGILRKKPQNNGKTSLTFVNALPTSAAESARLKSLVRANATKYQWRTSKGSAHRSVAQEVEREEPEEEIVSTTRSADVARPPLRLSNAGRETSSESVEELVRPSSPRRIWHSNDDQGQVPWLGLAFPMEWNSDPVPSQWITPDGDPNSKWGPATLLGAGKTDPFHVYPSVLPRESVARLIDESECEIPLTRPWARGVVNRVNSSNKSSRRPHHLSSTFAFRIGQTQKSSSSMVAP